MKRCPYCGKDTVVIAPYIETVMWENTPIHYDAEILHCTNPECPESNRFSYEQCEELKRQREKQLSMVHAEPFASEEEADEFISASVRRMLAETE